MTKGFFESQMRRLIDTFGERAYPQARMQLLFDMVIDYSEKEFDKFISSKIVDSKFPPIGPEFREFATEQEEKRLFAKRQEQRKLISEGKICIYCGNEGLALAIKKIDKSRWAFGCDKCDVVKLNPDLLNYGRPEDDGGVKKVRIWIDEFKHEFDLQNLNIWGSQDEETRNQRAKELL